MTAEATVLRRETPASGVLALRLNRPAARNALNTQLLDALERALGSPGPRAFVLGTTDSRCFCAGADLSLPDPERAQLSDRLYRLYEVMISSPAPIIAAIEGPAVGGGAQLAIASDMRIGSSTAQLRFAGPGHGLSVGAWALPSLVGRGRTIDLCLTMRAVQADEALRVGLLDRIEPDPWQSAVELAAQLAQLDCTAVGRVKAITRDSSRLLTALAAERAGNAGWSGSVEGLTRR